MNIDEYRSIGHRVVDMLAEHLESIEERPLFPRVTPVECHDLFDEPMPGERSDADTLIDELAATVPTNTHQHKTPG